MQNDILLSICIPTYNRCGYLDKCLSSIVSQMIDLPSVEVIIADNASTDETEKVVIRHAKTCNRVIYLKNDINIGAENNFIKVLGSGNGQFLKLLNDYTEIKNGGLKKIVEIITENLDKKLVLFFANGMAYLKGSDYYLAKNMNDFLPVASFWTTWIGTFGIWKDDFNLIMKYYVFKTSNFYQTELLFESINIKTSILIYTPPLFLVTNVTDKQADYDFFKTFINSYLNQLIQGLLYTKRINNATFFKEKNRFFAHFIFPWYKKIKIKKNHSVQIQGSNVESIIFKTYRYNFIFYRYLLFLPFYYLGFLFKRLVKRKD